MISACGSDRQSSTSPLIGSMLRMSDLSDTQRLSYCSWQTEVLGGAGNTAVCSGDGESLVVSDTAACVSDVHIFSHCPFYLFRDCVLSASDDLCQLETSSECNSMRNCVVNDELVSGANSCPDMAYACWRNGSPAGGLISLGMCWRGLFKGCQACGSPDSSCNKTYPDTCQGQCHGCSILSGRC